MPSIRCSFWKPIPWRTVFLLFVGTRLLLLAATCLSFILFPVPPHVYPQTPIDITTLLSSWNHWDVSYYLSIAQNGYNTLQDTAFFPLFPLLVKSIAFFFGNRAYWLAALLVSNGALFGALLFLYQIATATFGQHVGQRTLLYFCLFPTAFFLFAGYNEALFICCSCGALWLLRQQCWFLAGICGLFAALTRSEGVLLSIPFFLEFWLADDASQSSLLKRFTGSLRRGLPLLLIPLGTLLYCFFCWRHFGDPLAFVKAQKDWQRSLSLPWTGIVMSILRLVSFSKLGAFYFVHVSIDLSATIAFLILAVLSWRRLGRSSALWIIVLLLSILSSSAVGSLDPLVSNQRFVLEMFPAFITLAVLGVKYQRLHLIIIISFPFFQAIMTALFVSNRWMV